MPDAARSYEAFTGVLALLHRTIPDGVGIQEREQRLSTPLLGGVLNLLSRRIKFGDLKNTRHHQRRNQVFRLSAVNLADQFAANGQTPSD